MPDATHTFRLATPDDAQALLDIYAPYIATCITFEFQVPTVEEFRSRIEARQGLYPYVVCEEDGVIVGYSYASRFFVRDGYQWAIELSVYFSPNCHGRGLGRTIYGKVMDIAALQNVQLAYGRVICPNDKSNHLHLACGFELVGTFKNLGHKLGEWHDVNFYQKAIGLLPSNPEPFKALREVDPEAVRAILEG